MMHNREFIEVEEIVARRPKELSHWVLGRVAFRDVEFPLHAFALGREGMPTLALIAGVHGLERIGCDVVLAYLRCCLARLAWDQSFLDLLDKTRLLFIPIANPVGVARGTRSNGNGIDLMRNSPLDAEDGGGLLYRGHRWSPWLPFYRGKRDQLEPESRMLIDLVRRELFPLKVSQVVDVHSGFGAIDRLWFPYAHSRRPFPNLAEAYWIKRTFDESYPNHFYRFEPVARQYTLHGDLWDYLYLEHQKEARDRVFMPWTLEMGSWLWVKKNPSQILTKASVFDPVRPHRRRRILRRHLTLFDFMHRVLAAKVPWWQLSSGERASLEHRAMEYWYD